MTATATRPAPTPGLARTGRLIRCQVGGSAFVFPLERVAEVVALGGASISAPRGWIGTLVRNERPVPIGDLAFLLGLAPKLAAHGDARAMILRASADTLPFGVTVETVPTVLDIADTRVEPLPPSARRGAGGLVLGTIIVDDELLLLLDADAIIARLAGAVTHGPDGRITELRALPRRLGGDSGRLVAGQAPPRPAPSARELPALLLARMETADGGGGFVPAVPMVWIQEVRPRAESRPLPHAPNALSGILIWRGRALPVIDLSGRLTGIPGTDDGANKRRLLIVGPQGAPPLGALLVSGVVGLRTLTTAAAGTAPPDDQTLDPALLGAWSHHGEDAIAVLDVAALFA